MSEKKPPLPAILTCPECNKKFHGPIRSRLLGAHRHFIHGYVGTAASTVLAREKRAAQRKHAEPPTCPQCGKTFKNAAGLAGHLSKAHGVSGTANPYRTKNRRLARAASMKAASTKAASVNGKVRGSKMRAILYCPECNKTFRGPMRARFLGLHRRRAHDVLGVAASSIAAREQRAGFYNNEELTKGVSTNGNSSSPAHQPQQDEIDAYILGHTVASVQALIAHTAERDGISAELLTSRCAAILQSAALRKRGRPRSAV